MLGSHPEHTPDMHLHISKPRTEVHHLHQASQGPQKKHQGLFSTTLPPYLFAVHLFGVPLTAPVQMGSAEDSIVTKMDKTHNLKLINTSVVKWRP